MKISKSNLTLFKSLFPLEVEVTSDIIENSNIWDTSNCIGTNSLRKGLLSKEFTEIENLSWGDSQGKFSIIDEHKVKLKIKAFSKKGILVYMMDICNPITVIFKLEVIYL